MRDEVVKKKCTQCGQKKPWPLQFIGRRGKPINMCKACQKHYSGWESKTAEEKLAVPKRGVPALQTLRARLFVNSKNPKLGGIPSSMTSRGTCPSSCSFYGQGCFAEYPPTAHHWRNVGARGDTWAAFCEAVAALPAGTLWRHNVAGDLPGDGRRIDRPKLEMLVHANRGRHGFTFTHLPVTLAQLASERARRINPRAVAADAFTRRENQILIGNANRGGLTVNLSADSLEQADALASVGVGPVAVVVPSDAPLRLRTPAGRRVTICPAETTAALTCAECQLCAIPTRKAVVGFRSHGQFSRHVDQLVQLRRPA